MFIPIPPPDDPPKAAPPAANEYPAHAAESEPEPERYERRGSLVLRHVPEGVIGLEGMSAGQLASELERGGRFVIFQYCVSLLLVTFLRSSGVHFLRAGEGAGRYSGAFTFMSCVLGWWGFPWGPIYTLKALATNAGGGIDVTHEILADITAYGAGHYRDEEPQRPATKRRGKRRRG